MSETGIREILIHHMKPKPMTQDQFEQIISKINRIYLYLLGHGNFDPQVVELMKLAALSAAERRFEAREPW